MFKIIVICDQEFIEEYDQIIKEMVDEYEETNKL